MQLQRSLWEGARNDKVEKNDAATKIQAAFNQRRDRLHEAKTEAEERQQRLTSLGHPGAFEPVVSRVVDQRLDPGRLVSHRVPLDGLGDAFVMLEGQDDQVVKVVVEP